MKYLDNDPAAVGTALRALVAPGEVFEIRALHASNWRGLIGYFNDPDIAADAVGELSEEYQGIYVTLNPVNADCIYRVNNTFAKFVPKLGSSDNDITGRNWLPIDVDPIRSSGISSTDEEHLAALKLAAAISDTLELGYGFPEPLIASSGNGAHLLYPVALPNDVTSRNLVKEFVRALALKFNNAKCTVDTSVFNASRIWRLYGTVARKGSNSDTRPHRLARIISAPAERQPLTMAQIQSIARMPLSDIVKSNSAPSTYPADEARWRALNTLAMTRLTEWVPAAFSEAREYLDGYRISSEALGREREEDLSIQPMPIGIVDFGEHDMGDAAEGKRTPIGVLTEFIYETKAEAATWLAETLEAPESEFEGIADKYALTSKPTQEFLEDDDPVDDENHVKGFDLRSMRKATQVAQQEHKPLTYLIEGLLPRGAYILISRPKMGKSWLTLQLALAKAKGGHFLGYKVEKGRVLLLSLEEQERRIQSRIKILNRGQMPPMEDLDNLDVIALDGLVDNQFPRGEQGCIVLREIIRRNPDIKLIVIDTFTLFRDHDAGNGGSVYDRDYASVMPIVKLASELEISIVAVHHERKGATVAGKSDADFMEAANGSSGIGAAFEGVMRIEGIRTEEPEDDDVGGEDEAPSEKPHEPTQPRKLKISGRDIEKDVVTMNMVFDVKQGGWYRTGKQNVENAILSAVRSAITLTFTDLCNILPNLAKNEIKRKLNEMVIDNVLVRDNYSYRLEYAGEASDVPYDLLDGLSTAADIVIKLIEWRGSTPLSFLYEALKNSEYSASTIRNAISACVARKELTRVAHGEYKITHRGAAKLKSLARGGSGDEADDLL